MFDRTDLYIFSADNGSTLCVYYVFCHSINNRLLRQINTFDLIAMVLRCRIE